MFETNRIPSIPDKVHGSCARQRLRENFHQALLSDQRLLPLLRLGIPNTFCPVVTVTAVYQMCRKTRSDFNQGFKALQQAGRYPKQADDGLLRGSGGVFERECNRIGHLLYLPGL